MTRLSRDHWAMGLAMVTARRSTCLRRSVGCVLLNRRGQVIATGFNGVAKGLPHCNEGIGVVSVTPYYPHACPGATSPSGTNLDGCGAIHAEQNAIMQCGDVEAIDTAYVTASPCLTCTKLLMNTGCRHIRYLEEYPHSSAATMWLAVPGNTWEQVEMRDAL